MFLEIRPSADYRTSRLFELNRAYTQRLVEVVKDDPAVGWNVAVTVPEPGLR